MNVLESLLLIALGALLAAFRKPIAKYTIEFQNKNFRMRFGESELRSGEFMGIVMGLIVLAIALVGLWNNLRV